MIDSFMEAIARIPGIDERRLHQALRSAKLLRRRLESGDRPAEEEWYALFPSAPLLQQAQIHLDDGAGAPEVDPEATLTDDPTDDDAPEGATADWGVLLSDIPEEGLPADASGERIGSFELRRMVHSVRKGWQSVDYEAIPAASGFRDRLVGAARESGRLEYIRGLPRSA